MSRPSVNIGDVVVKHDLCLGCGFCAGVCAAGAIVMRWNGSLSWSVRIDRKKCRECGACLRVCPNSPQCISEYAKAASGEGESLGLGQGARYFSAYDLDPQNRIRSASGGAISAILKHLLESGAIDGAVVSMPLANRAGRPHYQLRIVRSLQELEKSRSSHYHPLCYDKVIKEMISQGGRYALMALPCISRAIKRFPGLLRERIAYVFSLACSHNVSAGFIDCLAKKEGVPEKEDFTVNLRDKFAGIPDAVNFNTYFKYQSKELRRNRFQTDFTRMWRSYFFAHQCCLYCPDYYGCDADLSARDAWGELGRDPLGTSLLIVRNQDLLPKLNQLNDRGVLFLKEVPREILLGADQASARFKQVEVFDRLFCKPVLAGELLKNGLITKSSGNPKKTNLLRYWQLRLAIILSKFLYRSTGFLPVALLIKISRILAFIPVYLTQVRGQRQ